MQGTPLLCTTMYCSMYPYESFTMFRKVLLGLKATKKKSITKVLFNLKLDFTFLKLPYKACL